MLGGDARKAVAARPGRAVMQTGGLLKDFTVARDRRADRVLFPPSRPVDEVLDRAGIADIGDRLVGKCSGGQQQRLRFALALLPDPDLLILDEPTTGMDVAGSSRVLGAIRSDAARGRTTVFATHYLEEADAYADRIVLVRKGRIVADGTAAEIKALAAAGRCRPSRARARRRGSLPRSRGRLGRCARRLGPGPWRRHRRVARYLLTHTDARDLEITSAQPRGRLHRPHRRRRRRPHPRGAVRMTARSPTDDPPSARPLAGCGFSPTFLRLELRRMLRNRRTVIFTLIMPTAFFLLFGTDGTTRPSRPARQRHRLRHGQHGRVRRDDRHHQRRRHGRDRARPRLEPAAAADAAATRRTSRSRWPSPW